jgi:Cu-processing system permease protein
MKAIFILAQKELRDGLRNRWVAMSIAVLTVLSLSLYLLGSAATGSTQADSLAVTLVNLVSLSVYLLPLIALMLSFDTLVGEFERGTMLLLAAYPIARWQIVMGKFLGHMFILLLAILISCGSVAVIIALTSESDITTQAWLAYGLMMASSWLLGGVFVALGYCISAFVRERTTAVGAAVGLWLSLVVLYDLALLGALLADEEQAISEQLLTTLLLLNPTDAYRVFNLTATEGISQIVGLTEIAASAGINPGVALLVLGAWTVTAILATIAMLYRREL